MANKITTLIDANDNTSQLYPRTKASAVSDNAGNSVESLLLYRGNETSSSSSTPINADQLQGYSVNQLLKFIYPVGSIYMTTNNSSPANFITGTTWTLRSSVALASEHVFGNGYSKAWYDGTNLGGSAEHPDHYVMTSTAAYGQPAGGDLGSGSYLTARKFLGSPTKSQLGNNPEYSGLIADTITIYTWERTA